MKDLIQKLDSMQGKTIESITTGLTEEDSIYSIYIRLSNGDILSISPTNYNYGGKHLNVEID